MRIAVAPVRKRVPSPWELYSLIILLGAAIYIPLSYLVPGVPEIHSPLRYAGTACPLCGGTRAVTALFTGQVALAFRYNPLAIGLLLALLWGAFSYLAMVLPFQKRVEFSTTVRERVVLWSLFVLALVANWAYILWSGMFEVPLHL